MLDSGSPIVWWILLVYLSIPIFFKYRRSVKKTPRIWTTPIMSIVLNFAPSVFPRAHPDTFRFVPVPFETREYLKLLISRNGYFVSFNFHRERCVICGLFDFGCIISPIFKGVFIFFKIYFGYLASTVAWTKHKDNCLNSALGQSPELSTQDCCLHSTLERLHELQARTVSWTRH